MPAGEGPVDIFGEWLGSARQEIDVSRLLLAAGQIGAAALHAQQALEKALKAELVLGGVRPRKTHDLLQLASDLSMPRELSSLPLVQISAWVVVGRYVFATEQLPSDGEVHGALTAAQAYLDPSTRL